MSADLSWLLLVRPFLAHQNQVELGTLLVNAVVRADGLGAMSDGPLRRAPAAAGRFPSLMAFPVPFASPPMHGMQLFKTSTCVAMASNIIMLIGIDFVRPAALVTRCTLTRSQSP